MDREERLKQIVERLRHTQTPVSGMALARDLKVSRQVIVQDMALLRADGEAIFSTPKGYLLEKANERERIRVYKVIHSDEDTADEMSVIVDCGGRLLDVFVYHKVYGVIRANLNVKSRRDIAVYMEQLDGGASSLLKNVTGGYHYHTVIADDDETLDLIQEELNRKGYLAQLQEYEPVQFGGAGK